MTDPDEFAAHQRLGWIMAGVYVAVILLAFVGLFVFADWFAFHQATRIK